MQDILLMCVFTTLVVVGVHAVTRPEKLLWFLGVRIHAFDKVVELQAVWQERTDALYNQKLQKENAVYEKYSDLDSDAAKQDLESIDDWYKEELRDLNNRFEINIYAENKRGETIADKPLVSLILPFAPALTECLTCMASFWGILMFSLYFSGLILCPFICFPLCVFAVAGLNTIASNFVR